MLRKLHFALHNGTFSLDFGDLCCFLCRRRNNGAPGHPAIGVDASAGAKAYLRTQYLDGICLSCPYSASASNMLFCSSPMVMAMAVGRLTLWGMERLSNHL
jgi:hypothetical protein